ncbi:AAR_G0048070.mRNA.1.CDS.1 [Saccharomyces cerevisiae]|nr:Rtc1p [Saccharomyces cerevisiae YJM193]AJT73752.1 Rtc1p [Saccharomyces cerevisiae YJM271]CAI4751399.1 AAR_G0048070.mRNA.1.CDS.1 [Saccharomyces cerevisiae]CAI6872718.1 AAR_G0048070.mRNA.1.CDS.1 [Saccharomyces cerevisiae]
MSLSPHVENASIPKGSTPIPKNRNVSSIGKGEFLGSSSSNNSSFRMNHYSNSGQPSVLDSIRRPNLTPTFSYSNGVYMPESHRTSSFNDSYLPYDKNPYAKTTGSMSNKSNMKIKTKKNAINTNTRKSSGLIYTTKVDKELSSIDKVNDPNINGLVCAGKTHLGLYKFSPSDRSIKCVHDFITPNSNTSTRGTTSLLPKLSKRTRQNKFSTIADVKTGFNNYKNCIAVCNNSTAISIYDLNKSSSIDNPLITSLCEHTRSINSFDFNMVESNLIISGGQDSCVKIWDLRSNKSKSSNRSDISINTASDSIRDVKWMPGYNFASKNDQGSSTYGNLKSGYKFASIHDSGYLLKFDLRQPAQYEKKLNAHTGPGLCLNWHPNQEYIATGGRDGKCCLWFVGDNANAAENTVLNYGNSPSLHAPNTSLNNSGSLAFPKLTINTGYPVTKLKFKPAYSSNIYNSLLGISSMGDEAEVRIYSLARKYIPKHVLLSETPSLGLVWWDENLIFNIDKGTRINGWDINKEPTVLENLSKNTTTWRDLDGNGLLSVDQEIGSYEVVEPELQPTSSTTCKKHPGTIKNPKNGNPENQGIIGGIKKGFSHTGLTSFTPERPPTLKAGPTFSTKSLTLASGASSFNSSSASLTSLTPQTENREEIAIEPPCIITLDIPQIFNNIRLTKIAHSRKKNVISESSSMKNSPVEKFKYLARQLKFSYIREHNVSDSADTAYKNDIENIDVVKNATETHGDNTTTTNNNDDGDDDDDDDDDDKIIESHLLKKYNFPENNTWATLMNEKVNNKKPKRNSSSSREFDEKDVRSSISSISASRQSHDRARKIDKNVEAELQEKIQTLVDLISIATHNASVYLSIDDLTNFKIWILIRDSLLWDLKWMTSSQISSDNASNMDANESSDFEAGENLKTGKEFPEEDGAGTSGAESLVEERPQAFRANSDEPSDAEKKPVSKLKEQLKNTEIIPYAQPNEDSDEVLTKLKELQNQRLESRTKMGETVSDDVIIEEDEHEHQEEEQPHDSPTKSAQFHASPIAKSIPILQKREHRKSFIDTFMLHSPNGYNGDTDIGNEDDNISPRFTYNSVSPRSKVSSLQSYATTTSQLETFKKLSSHTAPIIGSPRHAPSRPDSIGREQLSSSLTKKLAKCKKIIADPPWDTKKLIKQLYNQATETGNVVLTVNILFLFQTIYQITEIDIAKDAIAHFLLLLHRYELFGIAADVLKYCPFEDIMGSEGDQSSIRLFCERCGELITNESSKEKLRAEAQQTGNKKIMDKFGYWYCDSCKKKNTSCVLCERPLKKLTMVILPCGHEGHFQCIQEWFLDENEQECPGGCPGVAFI